MFRLARGRGGGLVAEWGRGGHTTCSRVGCRNKVGWAKRAERKKEGLEVCREDYQGGKEKGLCSIWQGPTVEAAPWSPEAFCACSLQ